MGDHSSPSNSDNVRFRFEPENLNPFSPISNFKASLSPKDNQDSLGILKSDFESSNNFLNLTFGGESVSKSLIFGDISDVGRESLGILQLDKVDATFGDEKLSEFSITNINSTRVLDVGFLLSPKKSCNSEGLSFNSESLDLPSKIYNAAKSDNSSVFSPIQSFLNNAQMLSSSHIEPRTRCVSQPTKNVLKAEHQIFWSVNQPKTTFLPIDEIQSKKLDFDDTDDLFHDSVFIEGKHLAQKIADGSFLEDVVENGTLDCTPQPDWPDIDDLEASTKESPKVNKESIFKTINKFFPNDEQKKEEEQTISDHKDTELAKKKTGRTKSDSASVMTRNPREILQNLTEIFNCTHRSENQKSQGRMLMNSLINLLDTSQDIQDCNDSGHSSIPEIEISPEDETDFKNPLKNPLILESEPKRRLSLSSGVDKKTPRPRNHSLAGGTTVTAKKKNDIKLKSKPGNTRTKEGPIKAVIPVEKMKKTRESIAEKTNNSTLPIKRTSTPVNEPKLKPNATSTPDNGSSRTVPKKVILAKVNSFNKIKVSSKDGARKSEINNSIGTRKSLAKESHPVNKIQIQDRKPHRSYSISEGMLDCVPRPKRSNSLGEERGIMSSLKRVRESMLKSPYYNKKSGILVDQNNSKNEIKPEKRVSFSDKDEAVRIFEINYLSVDVTEWVGVFDIH